MAFVAVVLVLVLLWSYLGSDGAFAQAMLCAIGVLGFALAWCWILIQLVYALANK